jgi:hypothetical protein
MSLLKNVGIGVAGLVGVTLVGYFGYKGFKKIRGKKEDKKECCIPTKEELSRLIQEDEKIIKDLENLHYSEDVIAPFRKSVEERKAILKELIK